MISELEERRSIRNSKQSRRRRYQTKPLGITAQAMDGITGLTRIWMNRWEKSARAKKCDYNKVFIIIFNFIVHTSQLYYPSGIP